MSKHPANDARPYTETSALRDILQWSKTRPDWLRDALRRLIVASEFSDLDIDELEALCLGTEDDASPLSDEHIAPQRLAGKAVAITGIRDPVAVNALARGQGVSFAATGLTIVYGDNDRESPALFVFSRVRAGHETTRRPSYPTSLLRTTSRNLPGSSFR